MERIRPPVIEWVFYENEHPYAWLMSYVECWSKSVNDEKYEEDNNGNN